MSGEQPGFDPLRGDDQPMRSSRIYCVSCRYDLSGATIGGYCSECGTPVADTVRSHHEEKQSSKATVALILGIVSVAVCMPLGPVAIGIAISARNDMASGGYSRGSRGMASAGLILGILATCFSAFYMLFLGIGVIKF
ncbi:MAG TPA: DUF4190 domain-containing protein [Phycisphaerales bacterium]|nr:DUF4190 domain-containing protein [Phycisphaerales bacterium]HRQ74685.1 DUF4190 domain-containing protein [Phycisphaerales bacterium]